MRSERLLAHTSVGQLSELQHQPLLLFFCFKRVGGGGGKASSDTARDRGETTRSETKPSGPSAPGPKSGNQFERTTQVPGVPGHVAEGGSVADHIAAMRGEKISGNTTTLPHTLQREYFRSNEYDLDGERMDTGEFLFDADASDQGESIDAPTSNKFGANDGDVQEWTLFLKTALRLHAEPLAEKRSELVTEVSSIISRDIAEYYLATRPRKACVS